ncbi:DMT family transporter [uncultured Apibacter sp.]|uniref:EamA family transporter n=1 Tax=uncultured Apibacter sp. TaxID=1778616 RepID=UPI0025F04487|nr:DMT family transporter [uncultured Apibacter sp.]
MNVNYLKSLFLVAFAAASYGVLATFVRLSYNDGYTTAEVTFSQAVLGLLGLLILHCFSKNKNENKEKKYTSKDKIYLILCGTSFGLTSTFYYLAVHYGIPVSICIVLLMQAVWMGALVDFIVNKKKPSVVEIIAIIFILLGTLLATNLINESQLHLNFNGVLFGILAAVSYTFSMFSSNKIALNMPPTLRSVYLLVGATLMVTIIWAHVLITQPFHFSIFYKWGVILAIFGTILPPFLFTKGMPVVGIGVGSIIASMELPVSVMMAKFVLNEKVTFLQWLGIVLILISIVLLNLTFILPKRSKK